MAHPKRYHLSIMLVILVIAVGVSARIYQLDHTRFDIDLMEDGLAPVKKQLADTKKISYVTNAPSGGVLNEVAFVLAPLVLSKSMAQDTLLYVQNKSLPPKTLPRYHTLFISENEQYQFILLQKNK